MRHIETENDSQVGIPPPGVALTSIGQPQPAFAETPLNQQQAPPQLPPTSLFNQPPALLQPAPVVTSQPATLTLIQQSPAPPQQQVRCQRHCQTASLCVGCISLCISFGVLRSDPAGNAGSACANGVHDASALHDAAASRFGRRAATCRERAGERPRRAELLPAIRAHGENATCDEA